MLTTTTANKMIVLSQGHFRKLPHYRHMLPKTISLLMMQIACCRSSLTKYISIYWYVIKLYMLYQTTDQTNLTSRCQNSILFNYPSFFVWMDKPISVTTSKVIHFYLTCLTKVHLWKLLKMFWALQGPNIFSTKKDTTPLESNPCSTTVTEMRTHLCCIMIKINLDDWRLTFPNISNTLADSKQ